MALMIVRIRSLYVSGIAEDDGSCRHRPLPQCLSGRGSFVHASQALRPEKRGSPLPMGRTGTDFIPLTLHCVRTRPAGKEVRLRLDFFDARFILSGSVLHFVPDTPSEGERRNIRTLQTQSIKAPHHTQRVRTKSIFIGNGKHSRASATSFIRIVFRFDILLTAINMLYATYVVKTCNALSPYAEIPSKYSSF